MTSARIRTTLFLLGISVLGGVAAVQLVRSVPHAIMFYLVGLGLLLMVLEPFMGLIVYLTFYYVRPHVLIPGFSNAPVLLVIGGSAFVSMLISRQVGRRGPSTVGAPQDYLLMWFFLAIVLSHLSHGRVGDAVSLGYAFLHTIVMYLVIINTVSSVRRLNIVLHCLGVLTIWVAIQGLIVRYMGRGVGGVEAVEGERVRVLGFYGDPNILAAGLLLLVPLFFLEMTRPGSVGRRLYSAIALLMLCYVVFLTNSRGGALTLAIVGTLLLARTVGVARGVLLGLFLAAAIYFLGPSRVHELDPTEPSAFGRLLAWKRAFGEFGASPFFGIGSKQSGVMTRELVPHNAFMQAAAEVGIFGLVPWVLLIFVSMKNAVFVRKRATVAAYGKLALLSEALFFACLAWSVSLLFVGSPYYDELYIFLGLSAAAAKIFAQMSQSRYQFIEKRDVSYAVLLIVLGLGLHRLVLYVMGA
jgi:O-antigen ligase